MGANRFISIPKYYKNIEELEFKLDKFSYRVSKDECLDLKPKVRQRRHVTMSSEQGILYEKLRRRALAIIGDSTISFSNKLTEMIKLHQVTNGFCKNDDGKLMEFGKQKINALEEIIEETDDKIIIWANYIYNIEQIKQFSNRLNMVKNLLLKFMGPLKLKIDKSAIESFQNNPKVRFFVSNPTTGGYGLTLTAANTVVYFSNNYNLRSKKTIRG